MKWNVAAATFLSGLIFAVGLGVSGMTQPSKIVGFLDLFGGAWDPSLALVMAGAIAVHLPLYRLMRARGEPVSAAGSCGPIDDEQPGIAPFGGALHGKLVVGAAIFGVGWGMGGYCPGPAVVSLAGGAPALVAFVVAMVAGMALYNVTVGRAPSADTAGVGRPSEVVAFRR